MVAIEEKKRGKRRRRRACTVSIGVRVLEPGYCIWASLIELTEFYAVLRSVIQVLPWVRDHNNAKS